MAALGLWLNNSRWRYPLAALPSVVLLSLAFPPVELSLLVFVALAPWLAALRAVNGKEALKHGWWFGFLFFLHQMYWVVQFVQQWTGSYALAALPWVLAAMIAGLFYMPVGWLVHRCWLKGWAWMIPLVWAGGEAFRAYVPGLAYPWGILATPLWVFPQYVQHAAFGTVFLVSAWAVLPSVILALLIRPTPEGFRGPSPAIQFRLAMLWTAILVLSPFRYANPPEGADKTISVGQLGIDMAFWPDERVIRELRIAGPDLVARAIAQGSDLLVLPEGFAEGGPHIPPDSPLGPSPAIPVVFGGNRLEGRNRFQTAYAYDEEWSYANKTRLVIFGEYVPFREHLGFLGAFNLPAGDLVASNVLDVVSTRDIRIGALLCFEGLFPDLAARHSANDAQLLAVMSIDDWFAGTPAPRQLMASTVWRSIESGLPLVRSASSGYTMATNARGKVLADAPWGERLALRVELQIPPRSDALDQRFMFAWLCWAVCLFLFVQPLAGRMRRSPGSADPPAKE